MGHWKSQVKLYVLCYSLNHSFRLYLFSVVNFVVSLLWKLFFTLSQYDCYDIFFYWKRGNRLRLSVVIRGQQLKINLWTRTMKNSKDEKSESQIWWRLEIYQLLYIRIICYGDFGQLFCCPSWTHSFKWLNLLLTKWTLANGLLVNQNLFEYLHKHNLIPGNDIYYNFNGKYFNKR